MTTAAIDRDRTRAGPARFALFAYGFRPFFLAAGAYAVVAMALWLAVFAGVVAWSPMPSPALWHGHEMVFGFTLAVIAGFLTTTTANWTGTTALSGPLLMLLVATWLAGRIACALAGWLPPLLVAAIDLAFLPLLAISLGAPLIRAGQSRQFVFVVLLAAMFAANALGHLEALGVAWADSRAGLILAIDLVIALIAVMGGRIIPAFTRNALRAQGIAEAVTARPWIETLALPTVAMVAILDLAAEGTKLAAVAALAAALVHAIRLAGWDSLKTRGQPILWVLHLGYAWLVAGLALKGLAAFIAAIPPSAALHALTSGAIGVLTLGVMSRVALGHTGRALAAPAPIALAYVLVALAAALRVFGPILWPAATLTAILLSGALWLLAFALFTAVYAPILIRPRADGKPG